MKVRVDFVSKFPKERILAIDIGGLSVKWKKVKVKTGRSVGKGVTFNGENADDRIEDIKGLTVKSVQAINPENKQTRSDVMLKSIVFIDSTEVYVVPRSRLPKQMIYRPKRVVAHSDDKMPRLITDRDIVCRSW